MVERILERGYVNNAIDANITYNKGKTPLIVAAENGHIGVVRMLLDSGKADLDRKDLRDRTALDYCALLIDRSPVHAELTKLFLDTNGIDLKVTSMKTYGPQIIAIRHGWEDTLKRLIQSGDADVNDKELHNMSTSLSCAASYGHEWALIWAA